MPQKYLQGILFLWYKVYNQYYRVLMRIKLTSKERSSLTLSLMRMGTDTHAQAITHKKKI